MASIFAAQRSGGQAVFADQTGEGVPTSAGVSSISLGALAVAGAGLVQLRGAAACVLAPVQAGAGGKALAAGALSASVGPLGSSASGVTALAAAGAVALQPLAALGQGTVSELGSVVGSGAVVIASVLTTAQGQSSVGGQLPPAPLSLQAQAVGVVTVFAQSALTLPGVSVFSSGRVGDGQVLIATPESRRLSMPVLSRTLVLPRLWH